MHLRLSLIAAALMASTTSSTWADTSNVDVYGNLVIALPTHETYSVATDFGTNFFSYNSAYTPLLDVTTIQGATAQISGSGYTASASTTLGGNHAYTQASAFATPAFGAASFSGWYDQVTIIGGTGTGSAQFTVQLNGTVDVGTIAGGVGYSLSASSVHPTQLTSNVIVDMASTPTNPWFLGSNQVTPITTYMIGASPYNDPSVLFTTVPPQPLNPGAGILGIPALEIPKQYADLVLTPDSTPGINITLHGTLNFTYGETFYLIGGLNTSLFGTAPFISFCATECPPPPTINGTGATTLDFTNSANLVGIVLPEGATASFASGNAYNVTAVPEPAEWLLLLAGLGLVGWRARHRA